MITNAQIKFEITKLKSSLCDYSDAYILVKETKTVVEARADAIQTDENDRGSNNQRRCTVY